MAYRKDNQHRDYNKRVQNRDKVARKNRLKSRRPSHVTVEPRANEHAERMIKRFIRKVKKSGVADEYRKNRYFEKPSVKRRKEKKRREAVLRKLRQKEGN